jgi:peptidoglycan/LPS O-acetylase OafA/YrhL
MTHENRKYKPEAIHADVQEKYRIRFLDGLRGIAILLVVGFHSYGNINGFAKLTPYVTEVTRKIPFFRFGNYGVQLFFLLSGFVILMTLEKSNSFFTFMYKRWIRLFPAMLIATILIFLTAPLLFERPYGQPVLLSALPGILFIEPSWVRYIFGISFVPLEACYWTLYVEFKFYMIFGLMYFLLGYKKAISGLILMYLLPRGINVLQDGTVFFQHVNKIVAHLSFSHFGWFATGAIAYICFNKMISRKKIIILLISVLLTIISTSLSTVILNIVIMFLFFIPIFFTRVRNIYGNKLFVFFGFISYPLYVIHESAIIALTIKLHENFVNIPGILLPVFPIGIIMLVSFLIARYCEPYLRKSIQRIVKWGKFGQ